MSDSDVWQRGSQPHINDASNAPTGADTNRTPAKVNCSLVTAAALLTYGTGQQTTSGDVARMLNHGQDTQQSNSNFGGGSSQTAEKQNRRQGVKILNLNEEAGGANAQFVANHSPSSNKVAGIGPLNDAQVSGMQKLCTRKGMNVSVPTGDQTLSTAIGWMKTQPDGTLFGVLLEGEGHWNIAKVYDDCLARV